MVWQHLQVGVADDSAQLLSDLIGLILRLACHLHLDHCCTICCCTLQQPPGCHSLNGTCSNVFGKRMVTKMMPCLPHDDNGRSSSTSTLATFRMLTSLAWMVVIVSARLSTMMMSLSVVNGLHDSS